MSEPSGANGMPSLSILVPVALNPNDIARRTPQKKRPFPRLATAERREAKERTLRFARVVPVG